MMDILHGQTYAKYSKRNSHLGRRYYGYEQQEEWTKVGKILKEVNMN